MISTMTSTHEDDERINYFEKWLIAVKLSGGEHKKCVVYNTKTVLN